MRDTLHKCVVAGLAVGLCALWIAVGLAQAPPVQAPPAAPVNQSDDPLLRNNRYALLKLLRTEFLQMADLSFLVVEGTA